MPDSIVVSRVSVATCAMVLLSAVVAAGVARASETSFPFGNELILDVNPMKGSKRVPMLHIGPEGETTIDLWCNSIAAQLVVVKDTLTVMTGEKTDRQCAPERVSRDDEVLDALTQVTAWRRNGDVVLFEGPKALRFRLPTN